MFDKPVLTMLSMLLFLFTFALFAQPSWTAEQQEILNTMDHLSAATAPGGGGAKSYAAVLADDYSRWTVGSTKVKDKKSWVDGVKEWFDEGWRVSDRRVNILEIFIKDDFAFIRRIVEETYLGPNKERSFSKAALAEVWVRNENQWLLLRVDVHPMPAK